MPVVLFDACASAARITAGYARTQSIPDPDQDPLIAEFLRLVRQTGADIAAHDPRTREVLETRAHERDESALIETRDVILPLANAVAEVSEGELAAALPQDAETATNPAADQEERRVAGFRLTGRMIRVGAVSGVVGLGAVGAAIIGIREIIWVAQLPQWQLFLKALWRYLGMA